MKLLLIVNASASSVTARARVVIQKSLAADHRVTVAETSRRGHATQLAQGAAATGTDVVVVLGGDGTLNEAANGLAGTNCALGVLPGGSTNVFARTIGMTNDPIEATGELLGGPRAPGQAASVRSASATSTGGTISSTSVSGYDAAVVDRVERRDGAQTLPRSRVLRLHRRWRWVPATTTGAIPTSSSRCTGRTGQTVAVEDGYLAICLKTNPYTFLGERRLQRFTPAPGWTRP